jgi:hypothetical protein
MPSLCSPRRRAVWATSGRDSYRSPGAARSWAAWSNVDRQRRDHSTRGERQRLLQRKCMRHRGFLSDRVFAGTWVIRTVFFALSFALFAAFAGILRLCADLAAFLDEADFFALFCFAQRRRCAREPIPAQAPRAWRPIRCPPGQARAIPVRSMARFAGDPSADQRGGHSGSQQAGSHHLGRSNKRPRLSRSGKLRGCCLRRCGKDARLGSADRAPTLPHLDDD